LTPTSSATDQTVVEPMTWLGEGSPVRVFENSLDAPFRPDFAALPREMVAVHKAVRPNVVPDCVGDGLRWPRKTNKEYTVSLICSIVVEYVAAQAFLEELHERPEYENPNDSNDYTLGRIGKHNVVIAINADGERGISPTARVARDIMCSFPSVKIGLLVGIGSGVPSQRHDIRLGDIVVSTPSKEHSGVIQYDMGKQHAHEDIGSASFMNITPPVLRAAMYGLRAQYDLYGHRLEEDVNSVLEKRPRLRKTYGRPDASTDRLYVSAVVHPKTEENCAVACGSDPSVLVRRCERTEDEENPAIHYGLIASSNSVIKDASLRDRLAAERDILCFEMEAAGIVNQFPCLVIRGICDYADSHKSKEWQGYAAMTAAAYTKDLLCRILPNKIEAQC
jgi:nucleoside phosphorylase